MYFLVPSSGCRDELGAAKLTVQRAFTAVKSCEYINVSLYKKKQNKKVTVIYFVWGFVHRSLSKKRFRSH